MADKRTVFAIPADTWVRVVNNATTGTIYRKDTTPNYVSMIFDNAGDTPAGTVAVNATAQAMFEDGNTEPVSATAAVYIWVRCVKAGQSGSVIVTL